MAFARCCRSDVAGTSQAPQGGGLGSASYPPLVKGSVPNASAITALVPLALPFHRRLQTRVSMALKNAGELLRKANAGELDMDGHKVSPSSLFALRHGTLGQTRSA
ncbi:hypothetical protein AB0D83_41675 [Streptomyces decoyicus]|uniref:hypothetical protein n=1 Tax=Streptomyces decoyicus TaxID=249567 RepID=UPI0033D889AA